MDAMIRVMRGRGEEWISVADKVGVQVKTAIRRAVILGLPTRRMNIGPVRGTAIKGGAKPPRHPRTPSAVAKWQETGQSPP